jgi:hypothetical protein
MGVFVTLAFVPRRFDMGSGSLRHGHTLLKFQVVAAVPYHQVAIGAKPDFPKRKLFHSRLNGFKPRSAFWTRHQHLRYVAYHVDAARTGNSTKLGPLCFQQVRRKGLRLAPVHNTVYHSGLRSRPSEFPRLRRPREGRRPTRTSRISSGSLDSDRHQWRSTV